jgi:membrane protease YdiL (CAAX protease family)
LISVSGILLSLVKLNVFILYVLIPFIISTAVIFPFHPTRKALSWVKVGKIDRISLILLGLICVLSIGALIAWAYWTDNLGLGVQLAQGVSHCPKWLIFFVGVPLFAIVNAFGEEVIYRGVLQEALMRVFKNMAIVLALQASAFAAAHFAFGFPNGYVGYVMVFAWGLMLGYLRIRTAGMLAPYLAHVIADLIIGYSLCLYVIL